MKKLLLSIAIIGVIAFASCKHETYYNITENKIDSTSLKVDSTFPITANFNTNQIIAAPNAIGLESITLKFNDSLAGTTISILSYVNPSASFGVSYPSNTILSLTQGSLLAPEPGNELITFTYLGNISGLNMVEVAVVLQP